MKLQEIHKAVAVIALTSLITIIPTQVYANEDLSISLGGEVSDSNETFTNDTEASTGEGEGNMMPLSREELLAEITQVCQDAATEEGLSAEDTTDFLSTCVSENMAGLDSYEVASSSSGEIGDASTELALQ